MDNQRDTRGRFSKKDKRKMKQDAARKSWSVRKSRESLEAVQFDHGYGDQACGEVSVNDPQTEGSAVPDVGCEVDIHMHPPAVSYSVKNLTPIGEYREIVELDMLAEGLEHCIGCYQLMSLKNAIGIQPYGLSGILYVKCQFPECQTLNSIPMGKRHKSGEKSAQAFDVNTKCASGKSF